MELGNWISSLSPVLSIEGESPGRCCGWTGRGGPAGGLRTWEAGTRPTGGSLGIIAREDARRWLWLWRGWDIVQEVLTYSWVLSRKWHDTVSAVGRSLLPGFGGGLRATIVFAHSVAPQAPVPASAVFSGRHLSPDHTAFYLFTCSLPVFLTGMQTPRRQGYVCIALRYLQRHHDAQ